MKNLIKFDDVNDKIITIRNQNVILDSAVAELYGVQTKDINKSVANNPDKFPEGYIFELTPNEKQEVVKNLENPNTGSQRDVVEIFHHIESMPSVAHLEKIKRSPTLPKAFTEKGLYMLATILKSPQATQATITIVEAFAKLKELSNNIAFLDSIDPEVIDPEIIESTVNKTGGLLNELFFDALPVSAETSVEFNFGFMKGKRTVKSEANPNALKDLENRLEELELMITKNEERLKKLNFPNNS